MEMEFYQKDKYLGHKQGNISKKTFNEQMQHDSSVHVMYSVVWSGLLKNIRDSA